MAKDDSFSLNCSLDGSLLKIGTNGIGLKCSVSDTNGSSIGSFGMRAGSENGKRNVAFSVSKDLVSNLIGAIDIGRLLEKVDLGKLVGIENLF